MPKRNIAFFDPKFNEWLYDTLAALTHEQKARLTTSELAQIRTRTALKQFVATGNLEKKLILLTKVGIEWSMLFYAPEKFSPELLKKAYRQYSVKDLQLEVIDEMLRTKTFVVNTKEVATALAMMSMDCHSEIFIANMEFLRVRKVTGEAAANISRGMSEKNLAREFNEGYNGLTVVARLVREVLLLPAYLTSVHNLQLLDLAILTVMFQSPNNFVSVDYLKRELSTEYKPASIGARSAYLWKERLMLEKMPASESVARYRITAKGILTMGEIANWLVNKAATY